MVTRISERFSKDNFLMHLKHYVQYMDDPRCADTLRQMQILVSDFEETYNTIATNLQNKPAAPAYDEDARIVGYISNKGTYTKYDKETGDFVVYNGRTHETVTLHKKTYPEYLKTLKNYYKEELPENQD